jgi:two-component system response regulator AtoC
MEPAGKILVVDDEPEALENCRRILRRLRFECITESDPRRALDFLERERPGLILTDLRMPGLDGMDVLTAAKRLDPRAQVVLMTAYATVQTAVSSMREGAFDFLTKPFSSAELEEVVRRALMRRTLRWEEEDSGRLIDEVERRTGWSGILGHSPAMREVLSLLAKIAPTAANVLIYGETGTGKELTARAIHARSSRADKPFVPVDCVSLTESLLETELFGHEKGSFTGAVHAKPGLFEMANGGTIFLDEVSGMSTGLQARLLRVLQERQVRPVGGTRFLDLDVRVLAASNQDLEQACARGEFRSDLFYRLNVIQVSLPPLRARVGDVELLSNAFLRRTLERNGQSAKDGLSFDPEALELLEAYAWPGNVRELQNVVERAAALADGSVITFRHLPERLHVRDAAGQEQSSASFKQAKQHVVKSFERGFLLELLKRHRGHITQAAREAGVDRKTIERMLKRHGLRELR